MTLKPPTADHSISIFWLALIGISGVVGTCLASSFYGFLFALLALAGWYDIHFYRIPNFLTFVGAGCAIICNSLLPYGIGFLAALEGLFLGLGILLPLYLMKAMGAGDVKLVAMVGAFVGPGKIPGILASIFIIGGVLTVVIAIRKKALPLLFQNLKLMTQQTVLKASMGEMPRVEIAPQTIGKFPYGVAISIGTWTYLLMHHFH